jgi:hypothetical protein
MGEAVGMTSLPLEPNVRHVAEPSGLVLLVKDFLDAQFDALVVGDQAIRDGRLEFIHPTRVATRRYRTVLRDMGHLFDSSVALVLDESLRWYARKLGGCGTCRSGARRSSRPWNSFPTA